MPKDRNFQYIVLLVATGAFLKKPDSRKFNQLKHIEIFAGLSGKIEQSDDFGLS
jgi:hypothetical protein